MLARRLSSLLLVAIIPGTQCISAENNAGRAYDRGQFEHLIGGALSKAAGSSGQLQAKVLIDNLHLHLKNLTLALLVGFTNLHFLVSSKPSVIESEMWTKVFWLGREPPVPSSQPAAFGYAERYKDWPYLRERWRIVSENARSFFNLQYLEGASFGALRSAGEFYRAVMERDFAVVKLNLYLEHYLLQANTRNRQEAIVGDFAKLTDSVQKLSARTFVTFGQVFFEMRGEQHRLAFYRHNLPKMGLQAKFGSGKSLEDLEKMLSGLPPDLLLQVLESYTQLKANLNLAALLFKGQFARMVGSTLSDEPTGYDILPTYVHNPDVPITERLPIKDSTELDCATILEKTASPNLNQIRISSVPLSKALDTVLSLLLQANHQLEKFQREAPFKPLHLHAVLLETVKILQPKLDAIWSARPLIRDALLTVLFTRMTNIAFELENFEAHLEEFFPEFPERVRLTIVVKRGTKAEDTMAPMGTPSFDPRAVPFGGGYPVAMPPPWAMMGPSDMMQQPMGWGDRPMMRPAPRLMHQGQRGPIPARSAAREDSTPPGLLVRGEPIGWPGQSQDRRRMEQPPLHARQQR